MKHFKVPSVSSLADQALAGDDDALRMLAEQSKLQRVSDFLGLYVPAPEIRRVFDRYTDAWDEARARALLDTVELPAVEPSNLGTGSWT